MENYQGRYIEYLERFADSNKIHIYLGGSFLRGNATPFSDVDVSAYCGQDKIRDLVYGYGEPVFISGTTKPEGILIVIYEDGVAADLEIIGELDEARDVFFHREDIKEHLYKRDESIWRTVSLRDDIPYRMSRLFHRSLIKYLAGKKDLGISVANEIVDYLGADITIDEKSYRKGIEEALNVFGERYPVDGGYREILVKLIGMT